jgi:predicted lipoprotein with Yx(FWY)xxD motif
MAKTITTVFIAFAILALAHDAPKGKPVSITGTVVDTGCYVSHDSKGEAHAKCAEACAKNGVPLAILDEHGTLYMPIAVEHKDQNAKLMPFIEKRVKVTGTILEKGGLKGIAIKTVEAAP